jgi:hypothetical protein
MTFPRTLPLARLVAAALLVITAPSQATLIGYNTDPGGSAWDRGDANTGFAIYDSFPSATFFNDVPDSSFGITTPELDQSLTIVPPGGLTGGGDRIYFHSSATSWLLTGSTPFAIKTAILQMKQHQGSTFDTLFSPTLNGIAADSVSKVNFTEGANNQSVTSWVWTTSLDSVSIANFSFAFGSGPNSFASFDGVQVDVAAVPEPAGAALIIGGVAMLSLWRRFRRDGDYLI